MHHDLMEGAAAAAEFTGLTRRKIYRLVDEGHLPCVRKGRRIFFRKSELRAAFAGMPDAASEHRVLVSLARTKIARSRSDKAAAAPCSLNGRA